MCVLLNMNLMVGMLGARIFKGKKKCLLCFFYFFMFKRFCTVQISQIHGPRTDNTHLSNKISKHKCCSMLQTKTISSRAPQATLGGGIGSRALGLI